MVWPVYVLLSVLLIIGSNRPERIGLLLIVAGLFSVSAAQSLLSESAFWLWSSMVWIAAGVAVGCLGNRQAALSGLLLVVAGACVIPARLMGREYALGEPFLMASDLFGICAVLCLGSGAIRRAVGRIRNLGLGLGRRHSGNHSSGQTVAREKA